MDMPHLLLGPYGGSKPIRAKPMNLKTSMSQKTKSQKSKSQKPISKKTKQEPGERVKARKLKRFQITGAPYLQKYGR
jgi:hypothetical protein